MDIGNYDPETTNAYHIPTLIEHRDDRAANEEMRFTATGSAEQRSRR